MLRSPQVFENLFNPRVAKLSRCVKSRDFRLLAREGAYTKVTEKPYLLELGQLSTTSVMFCRSNSASDEKTCP
jgi:hypothetical protein